MIAALKGKKIMIWSFMGNTRMYEALDKYGDRLDTVGIFTFNVDITGTISETGAKTTIESLLPYINKWPHINWLLTIMNNGASSIFTVLRNNTNGAKDKFLSEIIRIIDKYPWCAGVDIDLERGGGYENKDLANVLFRDIYNTVKSKKSSLIMNICLPGMTGVNGSVGGENWCVYGDLNNYCDTAAIMSYGMSWAGSAPDPVSPRSWLEGVYDYTVSVINPDKVFFGLPAYGWSWEIYDLPENLNRTYRGISHTYYAAQNWLTGVYHHDDTSTDQPFIPFFSYWDGVNKVPWALPHVYDFMEGWDTKQPYEYPMIGELYEGRRYLTSYGKVQNTEFGSIYTDRNGVPDRYTGNVIVTENMASLGEKAATATYKFNVSQSGTYDVAVKICYPFFDRNAIDISLDGTKKAFLENRLWWPYWRKTCWLTLKKGVFLSAGEHSIVISGGVPGVLFYGFRVCSNFNESPVAGTATYALCPRQFKDVNGNMVSPAHGFKLTFEMLRRKADSALIWFEDFRDIPSFPTSYWEALDGKWSVWHDPNSEANRPYSQLEGSGSLSLKFDKFSDIHVRGRFVFPMNSGGKAGVFCGDVFCCLNYDTQRIELYKGSNLIGSYATSILKTTDANIRTNPNTYIVEMRKRGNKVRVYSGYSSVLRFTVITTSTVGRVGIKSEKPIKCDLFRVGDAYTYEPYERFDVKLPTNETITFGRLSRTNVIWDDEFQVFTLTTDVEESETHLDEISLDYDFFHSGILPLVCGNDYQVTIIPKDINMWISRVFLGDSDGFSILYYQDVDSLVYWANEAAYRWKLRGSAIWSLGQEDMRLWEALPKQI